LLPTGKQDEEGREIRERHRRTFAKKKDAGAGHDKLKTTVREKRFLDVKREYRTTLQELADKYRENFQDHAYFPIKSIYANNFLEHFGKDTNLAAIRYIDIETYQNHLKRKLTQYDTGRAPAAVNREMACIKHLLGKAVEWDLLGKSSFKDGKGLSIKENNSSNRYQSEEEMKGSLRRVSQNLTFIESSCAPFIPG
jgi:hypothetical protein